MKTLAIIMSLSLLSTTALAQKHHTPTPTPTASGKQRTAKEVDEELIKLMKERMRISEKLLEDMLEGGLFQDFEKKFEKILEDMDKQGLEKFFKDDDFNQILRGFNPHRGLAPGDYRWMNTQKERILIFKMGPIKENELKIDIKDNIIRVSGTITKKIERKTSLGMSTSLSTSSFDKSFPVPRDVEASLAKIENKKGELLIRFPKKHSLPKKKPKKPMRQKVPPRKNEKVI